MTCINSSWRRSAACIASRCASQRAVLPSMSLKRKVTVPVGSGIAPRDSRSDTRVPFVALIFPIAAATGGDIGEAADQLDARDPLGALVTELRRHAQAHGSAVIGIERGIVE